MAAFIFSTRCPHCGTNNSWTVHDTKTFVGKCARGWDDDNPDLMKNGCYREYAISIEVVPKVSILTEVD